MSYFYTATANWMKDNVYIVGQVDKSKDEIHKTLLYFYPNIYIIDYERVTTFDKLDNLLNSAKSKNQIHIRGMTKEIYLIEQ